MTRKKNLSKNDLEDVSTWQSQNESQRGNNQLSDIQIKIKCKNEKQKDLKTAIEDNVITLAIGPAGCLIKSEKIKIYKLKT